MCDYGRARGLFSIRHNFGIIICWFQGKKCSKIRPIKFSTLYQDLPQYISTDMKKELTSPLALVALLHLCNENNLELRQDQNYKDFTVLKAVNE
jgi:hypothetical protein